MNIKLQLVSEETNTISFIITFSELDKSKPFSFQNRSHKAEQLNLLIYDKEDNRLKPIINTTQIIADKSKDSFKVETDALIYNLSGRINPNYLLVFEGCSYSLKADEKYTVLFRYGTVKSNVIKSNVILFNPARFFVTI